MISQNVRTVYMMGIGGIAMGTLAGMLKVTGFHVVGSDQNLYPPMSHHLEALQIPVCQGFSAENIQRFSPDLIIIGNVIRRDNPEAQFTLSHAIPYLSMPQAISQFFLGNRKSMVITGTHGKSTVSSLLAWVMTHAGMDPSVLIGAFVKNWGHSYRLGNGPHMVIEGDEYDTAFFDKGPKFLHYRPHVGVITSIEYDHADIFPDFQAVLQAFRSFVHLIPAEGYLVVNADDPHCLSLSRECRGKVITYGQSHAADWRLVDADYGAGEVRFDVQTRQSPLFTLRSPLAGRHNASNTLAALAAGSVAGVSPGMFQEGLLTFQGVTRRQDIIGERNGILIIDDFAHHPTAVRETILALRRHHPTRRLLAVFEPRTNSSRRRVFQDDYAAAFDHADLICIKQPPEMAKIPEAERLDSRKLVADICRVNKDAYYFETSKDLLGFLLRHCRSGDLVLCMSNGSFDGLPRSLFDALGHNLDPSMK